MSEIQAVNTHPDDLIPQAEEEAGKPAAVAAAAVQIAFGDDAEFEVLAPAMPAGEREKQKEIIRRGERIVTFGIWQGVLLNGYGHREIFRELGMQFPTEEKTFNTRMEAELWIVCEELKLRKTTLGRTEGNDLRDNRDRLKKKLKGKKSPDAASISTSSGDDKNIQLAASAEIAIDKVEFVKALYPRLQHNDDVIERYRGALDLMPPIVTARGHILVDGFHRWQAAKLEGRTAMRANDLGNLTDIEIMQQSIRRNSRHGYQLEVRDKKRIADHFYRQLTGTKEERYGEIGELLSLSQETAQKYCEDARRDQKAEQQVKAWDLWLDCYSEREIAKEIGVAQETIGNWVTNLRNDSKFSQPPEGRQHFDVWPFQAADDSGPESYLGRMPGQVIENLLWAYTEPGQIVVDLFAGGGTTIDVAKGMGRRVWASDRRPSTPTLPIHEHDVTTGWPKDAPAKADFILLDPPYWMQAKGRYSNDPSDLGNMTLDGFLSAWTDIVSVCAKHLQETGKFAFIVSPVDDNDNDRRVDLMLLMYDCCKATGLTVCNRIIGYTVQHATAQEVQSARTDKRLLSVYRDIVVFKR